MGGQFETMYPGSQELIWTRILLIRCSSKVSDNKHLVSLKLFHNTALSEKLLFTPHFHHYLDELMPQKQSLPSLINFFKMA